jgi:hypothetical protein
MNERVSRLLRFASKKLGVDYRVMKNKFSKLPRQQQKEVIAGLMEEYRLESE